MDGFDWPMVENIADVSCTALVPIDRLILMIKKYVLLEDDDVICTAIRSVAHKVVRYCTGDGFLLFVCKI